MKHSIALTPYCDCEYCVNCRAKMSIELDIRKCNHRIDEYWEAPCSIIIPYLDRHTDLCIARRTLKTKELKKELVSELLNF